MSPQDEYRTRLERWTRDQAGSQRRFHQTGNARLATGVAALAIAAFSLGVPWISPWWLLAPLGVFIGLAIYHDAVDRRLMRATRAATYYDRALARVENRWIGTGNQGARFADPKHLYADDLDVFGRGGLFELLSTARTSAGERTLAEWLLRPGSREEVAGRQQAVAELRPRIDLREGLALMGEDVRAAVDDRALAGWGAQPAVTFFPGARWIAAGLALAAVVAAVAYFAQVVTLRPLLYVILAEAIFGFAVRDATRRVVFSADTPAHELRLLALLLERLEGETFSAPSLAGLQRGLAVEGKRATEQIRRLERLVDRLDWARNQFFRLLAAPLVWIPQFAMAIENWRGHCGRHIGEWVQAVGEFEALGSLAGFAHERPDAVLPELMDSAEPVFEASGLAHPLIPPGEAVANDVVLGGAGGARLWIVSGSNMSGKSTLLRAVGLNAVLAWAGAPVTARSLRVSRLEIGASLRTIDSLADHRSRFYAEISRLRDIVELARQGRPALFLLDELLSGTNSHDRRIGAEAVVRGLVVRGAIGMVTTHDLALAEIASQLDGRAANVHFQDHLQGGEIRFDYQLRPGVVERSNALELMRAVGLDV
jgi:hypothetical protein